MNYVKMLVPLMASLGVISFVIGSYLKMVNMKQLFNIPPAGWWRASIAFLAIGILYVLIDIRDILRKTS
jgi:membrane-bound ClpP family serine protease